MISRMRASIRSRSSGVNVPGLRPARAGAGSRSRSRPRSAGRWRTWPVGTGRGPPGPARAPSSAGSCRARGRVGRDDRDRVAVGQRPHEVALDAVHLGDHRRLAEPATDGRRQLAGGGAGRHLARGTVRERDRDVGHPAIVRRAGDRPEAVSVGRLAASPIARRAPTPLYAGHLHDGVLWAAGPRPVSWPGRRAPRRSCGGPAAARGRFRWPRLPARHAGRLGRDRLGLLRGVLVHVLLAGQLADLVHHLVDDLAQPHPVVATVLVVVGVDRPAEAHGDRQPQLRELRVRAASPHGRP